MNTPEKHEDKKDLPDDDFFEKQIEEHTLSEQDVKDWNKAADFVIKTGLSPTLDTIY